MSAERLPTDWKSDAMRKRIARRYAAERRFKAAGMAAVLLSAAFLAFLLFTMVGNGMRGFTRTEIALKVDFPASPLLLDPANITDEALANANLPMVTSTVAQKALGKDADAMISPSAWIAIRDAIKAARAEHGLHGSFHLDSPASCERIRMACSDDITQHFVASDFVPNGSW